MEAVDMERRLLVIVFVLVCLCVNRTWSVHENENVVSFQSYAVSAADAVNSISSRVSLERSKRDVSDDQAKCSKQEEDFLSSLKTNTHLANKVRICVYCRCVTKLFHHSSYRLSQIN